MTTISAHAHTQVAIGCINAAIESLPAGSIGAQTELEIARDHLETVQRFLLIRAQRPDVTPDELDASAKAWCAR